MSTFFRKLTGLGSKDPSSGLTDAPSQKEEARKTPRKPAVVKEEEPKAVHLKVETEDAGESLKEEIPEEEGELTVDIYDKGDSIVIQSTVAGVKPEDLDVSITEDTVTIRGRRERQEETKEKDYYYKELFWGTFSRSVILPEEIDDDLAEANLKHGLLTLILPKKKRGVVQKLKVKVS